MSRSPSHGRPSRKGSGRSRWRRLALAPLLPLLALLAPGEDALAQGTELRLVPAGGVMVTTSELYHSGFPEARAELANAPVVSLGLHAVSESLPVSARLTVDRADWFNTNVEGTGSTGVVHPFTVATSITLLTADLLFHGPVGGSRLDPYAFVGYGLKSYAFGEEEPSDDVGFKFPEDASGGRVHYGVGVEVGLVSQPLVAELGGNYNRFVLLDEENEARQSHPQHEFVMRFALPIGIASF